MVNLLRSLDPLVIGMIVLPLALVGAAWALRMACAICSVRVPEFVPAATAVVVCLVANFGLRILLKYNHLSLSIASQFLLVLLTSAVIVSISIRTSIASAIAVTITQVFLCGLIAYGLNEVSQSMF